MRADIVPPAVPVSIAWMRFSRSRIHGTQGWRHIETRSKRRRQRFGLGLIVAFSPHRRSPSRRPSSTGVAESGRSLPARGPSALLASRMPGLGCLMIEIVLANTDLARVRFAHSPVTELVASFRVLHDPSRDIMYGTWLSAVRGQLGGLRLELLTALAPTGRFLPDFLLSPPTEPWGVLADELDAVAATPPAVVRADLEELCDGQPLPTALRPLYDDPAAHLPAAAQAMGRHGHRAGAVRVQLAHADRWLLRLPPARPHLPPARRGGAVGGVAGGAARPAGCPDGQDQGDAAGNAGPARDHHPARRAAGPQQGRGQRALEDPQGHRPCQRAAARTAGALPADRSSHRPACRHPVGRGRWLKALPPQRRLCWTRRRGAPRSGGW